MKKTEKKLELCGFESCILYKAFSCISKFSIDITFLYSSNTYEINTTLYIAVSVASSNRYMYTCLKWGVTPNVSP